MLGVGNDTLLIAYSYISELSPASHRGRLVVISVLFITIGQLIAYAVSLILSPPVLKPDLSWRWTLGLGGVPAVIQLFLMFFMPETPRWQYQHIGPKAAARTLAQVYGTDSPTVITPLLASLAAGMPSGPRPSFKEKLRALVTIPGNRRALTLACFLQFLQQACGFNVCFFRSSLPSHLLTLLGVDVFFAHNLLKTWCSLAHCHRHDRCFHQCRLHLLCLPPH